MVVKNIEFKRDFLKHTNFKNGFHVYDSLNTVADSKNSEIPESVIRVLYRIYTEVINNKEDINHE